MRALRVVGVLLALAYLWAYSKVLGAIVTLALLWRLRGRRQRALAREMERLAVEAARAKVLAAQMEVGPDVVAADRDYRAGRITEHDRDVALAQAAEEARARGPHRRFKVHG